MKVTAMNQVMIEKKKGKKRKRTQKVREMIRLNITLKLSGKILKD